ncbi:MAG TPA: TIGR00282 family metallophosphoesterase [Firmicutes bacterium]|nr:TIGR00282 family metallophosphoesterase [Bacillota bacterium]
MRILFFGDIVGRVGREAIKHNIEKLIKKYQIDFVIANGENVTHGKGLIEKHYDELINDGIDVVTLGNHYLGKNRILNFIDGADSLVRPLNLIKNIGGQGSIVKECDGIKIRVTNLLGTAFMKEEVVAPYLALKQLLDEIDGEDSIHIVDFHAEATGEKMCIGYTFDGLVSAVVGTHTHVQTNDAKILEKGTAFISDIGMCGAANGVLGFERNSVINKTIFGGTERFEIGGDDQEMINAIVLDIDNDTKRCKEIFTVKLLS